MDIIKQSQHTLKNPLADLVFPRLLDALALLPKPGPRSNGISHRDFILSGALRPLIEAKSGRDAIQKWAENYDDLFDNPVFARSSWFGALHSVARLEALSAVANTFRCQISPLLPDRLEAFPELANYQVWTGDGHWHAASLHDQRYLNAELDSVKLPAGHIYFYNHRNALVVHFETCKPGTQEHDMSVLDRKPLDFLLRDAKDLARAAAAARGKKRGKNKSIPLIIYDRAAVDFPYWNEAKRKQGIHLITRDKVGLVYKHEKRLLWDEANPINARVLSDELVLKDGQLWRRITTARSDQNTEDTITILTNDLTLPPGLVCLLYHRRWDIERTFDDVKHKFYEEKAWASSLVSKSMQGEFIALSWNVLQLLEYELAEQDVTYVAEENRRAERTAARAAASAEATLQEHAEFEQTRREAEAMTLPKPRKTKPVKPVFESPELYRARRMRVPVKLIRWFRNMLQKWRPWEEMLDRLKTLYATL